MITTLTTKEERGYEWLDVIAPSREELQQLAGKYHLHEASVNDSLQADHLPKFEHLKGHIFCILRVYTGDSGTEADTVQELTDKIAVFISNEFIITIHRLDWEPIHHVNTAHVKEGDCALSIHVLEELVKMALISFDEPARKLTGDIEYYEQQVFLKDRRIPFLRGLYFFKRKVDVIQRILLLSFDIIDNIDQPEKTNVNTRDIRDLYVKQQSVFDSLATNTNHLLTLYFNISSQKTNETIRVLTIFSVFFMPLTFIVGVYGMNFHYMPELGWRYGYPSVMVLMLLVVVGIFIWFKQKKWL